MKKYIGILCILPILFIPYIIPISIGGQPILQTTTMPPISENSQGLSYPYVPIIVPESRMSSPAGSSSLNPVIPQIAFTLTFEDIPELYDYNPETFMLDLFDEMSNSSTSINIELIYEADLIEEIMIINASNIRVTYLNSDDQWIVVPFQCDCFFWDNNWIINSTNIQNISQISDI